MKKEDLVLAAAFAITLSFISILVSIFPMNASSASMAIVLSFCGIYGNSPNFSKILRSLSLKDYLMNRITKLIYLSVLLLASASNAPSPWQNILLDIITITVLILSTDYLLRNKENTIPIHQNDTIITPDDSSIMGVFAILVSIVTLFESYILPSIFTNYVPDGLAFMVILFMGNVILKTATSYRKFIQCCFMTLIVGTTASISAHYTWSEIIAIAGSLCLTILLIDFIFDKVKKPVGLSNTEAP